MLSTLSPSLSLNALSISAPISGVVEKQDDEKKQPTRIGPTIEQEAEEYILSDAANKMNLSSKFIDDELWLMYKKQRAVYWTPDEINLSDDRAHWDRLDKDQKHFIKHVLAFFAGSDFIVNANLVLRFMAEVKLTEAGMFYGFQNAMEGIHSDTYRLLLDFFAEDDQEREHLFAAIKTVPAIQKKAAWAQKWTASHHSFAARLIVFGCVEGIHFSGSFCAIFYFKKQNLLPGLTFSNELISRDEGLHTEYACTLYARLKYKLSQAEVEEIFREAVAIESEFVTSALPVKLIGMNGEAMIQYIQYVADRLLAAFKYKKIFNVTNPFPWMEVLSMQGKTNFFEKKVSDYNKNGTGDLADVNRDTKNNNIIDYDHRNLDC